jgi:hypothetical protein
VGHFEECALQLARLVDDAQRLLGESEGMAIRELVRKGMNPLRSYLAPPPPQKEDREKPTLNTDDIDDFESF